MHSEVNTRNKLYRDIKWFSYGRAQCDPCPESLPMFQMLASQVDFVDKRLIHTLARQVISHVCEHLSAFYIHDIILVNHFSNQACEQLKVDIEKGMNAIFSQHFLDETKLEAHFQLKGMWSMLSLHE